VIDWTKQHCGVHQAPYNVMLDLIPDIKEVVETFPDDPSQFTWDVKVHMLMPNQYPCIPNWHVDNIPRINGIQRYDLITPEFPMYLWISGPPLTQFKHGFVLSNCWHRFTQLDEHRGTASGDFCWRGFIRATHTNIVKPKQGEWLRRHCQVYLDANSYQW